MASTGVDISSPPSGDEEKGPTTRLGMGAMAKDGREFVGEVTPADSRDHTERRLKSRHSKSIPSLKMSR